MSVRGDFKEGDFKRVCSAAFVQIAFGREGRVMNGVVISNIDCTSSTGQWMVLEKVQPH
jgi:hypothetical protein